MKTNFLRYFLLSLALISYCCAAAGKEVLNLYNWSNYLPDEVIHLFEKETGIHINYSTYDSNETLYAKLKTNRQPGYDLIIPSTYFLDRMRKENLLQKIDKAKLSGFKNLDSKLLNHAYDPHNDYSVPYLWGTTALVLNTRYFPANSAKCWADLWDSKYRDQLMLLDDQREVFAVALKILTYSVNDTNPEHMKQAYLKLKELMPNVKLFNDEAQQAVYIDEDAVVGMGWNGDIYIANKENPNVTFIYPKEGVTVWLDSMAIPAGAAHVGNAYKFINFVLRPYIAAKISSLIGYATPNLAAFKLLPKSIQQNHIIYPTPKDLHHSEFLTDLGDAALIYEKYWELLKIGG